MGRVTWINLTAASLIARYIADAGSHVRFTAVMLTQLLGKSAQKQQRARQNFCESGQHVELLVTNRELQAQNLFDCRSATVCILLKLQCRIRPCQVWDVHCPASRLHLPSKSGSKLLP